MQLLNTTVDLEYLTEWGKDLLYQPLHNMHPDLGARACKCYKWALAYMVGFAFCSAFRRASER